MSRHAQFVSALGLSLLVIGCSGLDRGAPLGVPTAMAAHEICSAVFVSRFDAQHAAAATVTPQLGLAAGLLRYQVDETGQAVRASLSGLATRTAVYRGAYGCIVDQGAAPRPLEPLEPRSPGPPPWTAPAATNPAVEAALDLAFAERAHGPRRRTYAAVIVHDGRLVAERYAPGVTSDSLLHGWSMTKSLTNGLLGVLVRQGRLDMERPAPVAAWRERPEDPRAAITPDDLLRMRSGLAIGQSLAPGWSAIFNPANQIMFARPDMAGAAAAQPLARPTGEAWRYSDGATAILGAIIRDVGGNGDPAAAQSFARRELFDKIGLGPVVLETDAAGAPIAATQAYASARDWARLGQLYLDDGMAGGERILPPGWVAYSTQLTPQSGDFQYGAGFWVNPAGRAGMPPGSFMARGARGQYVVVVPQARLVVVKLGDADTPLNDLEPMGAFVAAAVAALGS